ncbi:outer membrane porin GjpA [Mycolicibacterium monacense]|uniref:PE-PGRS family protein n=2 Tax=Mycobacteriaceae TaxID=1762 RepID=A0AAD1MZS4_MYCMB|nr:outer membrane porin GjpA [Mycolicibacterium monacense]MDA4102442.1 hypothetical protein [Mycolicibacterium monacense DSM 44395]ORB17871.1 hypothetical protein BST34_17535 [Mycolicibacterium monacense DSM 44395]QHP88697.1 hypothetical protein EWR22_26960 [Mycolicibacterium monacense DSM 44395]BBZ63863.1 hypothetical protein MMON_51640 [Mycolicibacterium monacense]
MELRLRPYATAGVALVGASAIAMAPLAPPLPDVKIASPSVNLSADIDPFTPWVNVFENAETNIADLIDDWAEAPFPVLQQVIVNQLGYFSELPDFELIAGQVLHNLEAAVAVLYEQDLSTLGPGFVNGIPNPAIKQLVFGLLPTFAPALADLQPLLDFSTSPLSGVLFGLVGPVIGPVLALASSIEAIVGNLTSEEPDVGAAFNTLINIPAAMADAFLNGGQVLNLTPLVSALDLDLPEGTEIGIAFGGLLSPGGSIFNALDIELDFALAPPPVPPFHISIPGQGPGAIGSLINLSQAIARALGWDGTGNPLHEEEDTPPPAPEARLVGDTSIVNASTTAITVPETTDVDAGKTGDVTPSTDGAAAVDTTVGSGAPTEVEQVKVEDNLPAVLDEETDTTPEKPATKRVNPGAKIAGALKSAGDQLNSAVNDLGKKLTKRPSKKAPAADNEKASAPEKDTSTDKAPAASE